ncbi:SDR family NAD(P)-dependent oxidoreductase [Anaplasma capra]|uniref:SDR family NAD(P)-dependent oxidoreductase n=1 Tax=Anaplasma capra TaxID=1562740 RepID=UPI0021D57842|nr:SDR family NAD(P)-dependent oxidoreductase [Anaplasma capra]MCU7612480.1 SDR family NAD(P)-dependent oxidoreductase [Anaplasma capra]
MCRRGVIITGAARRIGRAMAIFLAARHGYDVVVHYNQSCSEALDLQAVIQEIYGRRCLLFQSDLRDFASLDRLITYAFSEIPHCDTLINNASVFYTSTLKQLCENAFVENFDIHVKAPVFLTQYFARMCTAKCGKVINIVDTNITRIRTKYFAYLLSKKSLADFTEMAAGELTANIQVNAICPPKIPDHEIDDVRSLENIDNVTCLKNFLSVITSLVDHNNMLSGELIHI